MKHAYFLKLECCENSTELELQEVLEQLNYDERGLIPVVTQGVNSKQVLMMAWMNKDALNKTLTTGRVTYWSRSRQQLWVKGETSGHTQELVSLSVDCDGDTILCQVKQKDAACHTGRKHCFYLRVDNSSKSIYVEDC